MRYPGIKGQAWNAVRRAIKRRDRDCYTCPRKELVANGLEAHAGHYLPVGVVGSHNKLSWLPELIHMQCSWCNGQGEGMPSQYRAHLIHDYGEKKVVQWERRKDKIDPVKDWVSVILTFDAI